MKVLTAGGGVGAGTVVMLALVRIFESDPALISQAMSALVQWGPLFAIAVGILVVGDRRFGQMTAIQKDNSQQMVAAAKESAEAQQKMADAVTQLAERDDRRQQKLEIEIGYVGTKMDQVLNELADLKKAVNSRAAGATA